MKEYRFSICLSLIIIIATFAYTFANYVDDDFGFGNLVFLIPLFVIPYSLSIIWGITFLIEHIKSKLNKKTN